MIKFTFLAENKTDNPKCNAEHGLSIYIETPELNILFDAGASDMFISNARARHVDLGKADVAVISHGHYDHTNGLPQFIKINEKARIYIHKDAFSESYGMLRGQIEKEPCSILWTDEQYKNIEHRLCLTEGPLWLTDDILVSGTIPEVPGCEMTEKFYKKLENEEFIEDDMSHEQFLAIRTRDEQRKSKGILIFSGCSHKGVIPVLRYARKLMPDEKIRGLIAGMHLYNATSDVRSRVVSEIMQENMEMVMPVHCTGINAICDLKAELGEKCIVATAGCRYIY